jgi:hypothetical protein
MRERVVLIPGYGSSLDQPAYEELFGLAERNYSNVHGVDVPWHEGTFDDWFTAVLEQMPEGKSDVIAYSCGALLGLQLGSDPRATGVQFDTAFLLSTSYWGGNERSMQPAKGDTLPAFTPEQTAAFIELPIGYWAHTFRVRKAHIFYGENELWEMERRSQDVHKLIGERASLDVLPYARHADMLRKPALAVLQQYCSTEVLL